MLPHTPRLSISYHTLLYMEYSTLDELDPSQVCADTHRTGGHSRPLSSGSPLVPSCLEVYSAYYLPHYSTYTKLYYSSTPT